MAKEQITKEDLAAYKKVAKVVNAQYARDIVPCIRILPGGGTEIIDCKTGKPK